MMEGKTWRYTNQVTVAVLKFSQRTTMLMRVRTKPIEPVIIMKWGTSTTRHFSGSSYRAPRTTRLRLTDKETAMYRIQMKRFADGGTDKRPPGHLVGPVRHLESRGLCFEPTKK